MTARPAATLPLIVVMGVSGSGKTTIGGMLAARLGVPYAEADDFHPAANIAKMAAGRPWTTPTARPGWTRSRGGSPTAGRAAAW